MPRCVLLVLLFLILILTLFVFILKLKIVFLYRDIKNMIGKLNGKVDQIFQDHVILDVSGVGYMVYCSLYTLTSVKEGEIRSLLIDSQTKEDGTILFGFIDNLEKACFRYLISVQGIGGRMALSILSTLHPNELLTSICNQDAQRLQTVSGVGQKLAARIIIELSSNKQVANLFKSTIEQSQWGGQSMTVVRSSSGSGSIVDDAITALVNLGFQRQIVGNVINSIIQDNSGVSLEKLIRLGLNKIAG
ncbi:Holliday junction ATP-dependent DNA helicase RuvA [Alphaproteobacteria bacterium]